MTSFFAAAAVAVHNIVRVLVVHKSRIERAELTSKLVHFRHLSATDTMGEAMLLLYLYVFAAKVMQNHRKEGDVVGKPHARGMPAHLRDPFAYAAVHCAVQRFVFYI